MKKLLFLGLFGLIACQNNSESESTAKQVQEYPIYEQSEVELNNKVVYAVVVRDSSTSPESRAYKISFKLEDRVWYDTLIMDLPGKRMVQGEAIFSDAEVNDMGGANFEVEPIEIQ